MAVGEECVCERERVHLTKALKVCLSATRLSFVGHLWGCGTV